MSWQRVLLPIAQQMAAISIGPLPFGKVSDLIVSHNDDEW